MYGWPVTVDTAVFVKSQGGYSLGLFQYDSFVSFRAIGIMGYLWSTAGLMFCSCGFPLTLVCDYC